MPEEIDPPSEQTFDVVASDSIEEPVYTTTLFVDEEQILIAKEKPAALEAWDELTIPLPEEAEPDLLRLLPDEIAAYLSFTAPLLQLEGDFYVGECILSPRPCSGRMRVHKDYGWWEVQDGCAQQGSIYAFEMRLRGLTFADSVERVKRWVARKRKCEC